MAITPFASLLVAGKRAGKIVKGDLTGGDVVEDGGDGFRIGLGKQLLISALITGKRLGEAILAMVDIAEVDLQSGKAPEIATGLEDTPRFLGGGKSFVVLAKQKVRLNGGAERARQFIVIAQGDINIGGAAVILDGELMFANPIQRIRLTAEAVGQRFGMVEALGDRQAAFGEGQRLRRIGAKLAQHKILEAQNGLRRYQRRVS